MNDLGVALLVMVAVIIFCIYCYGMYLEGESFNNSIKENLTYIKYSTKYIDAKTILDMLPLTYDLIEIVPDMVRKDISLNNCHQIGYYRDTFVYKINYWKSAMSEPQLDILKLYGKIETL